MATKVRYEIIDQAAYITFYEENERRPITLDWDSLAAFEEAVVNAGNDTQVRAIVVRSASSKSFVVGANIAVLKTQDRSNIIDWVKNGHRIFGLLQKAPVPVIAVVEHYCLGGGLELAMACDMILCTEEAKFAHPEAGLGVMPGWGGTGRLAKYIGMNRAKEMIFTGEQIDAKTAYEWGLVNHVYAKDEIDDGLNRILDMIRKNDANVLHYSKEIVNTHQQNDMEQNALEEAYTSSVCMASDTTAARLKNFFESRKK